MGDSQLLNDCLYESYNGNTYYLDDNMKKTSLFLEHLSHLQVIKNYSVLTGNFSVIE